MIYVIKGSETYDVKGPTSIIQKVMTTMFGSRTLNTPYYLKRGLLMIKVLIP